MTEHLIETITRKFVVRDRHPAVKPVDASSIILIDRRDKDLRILMGKRNPAAKFMPGVFVFPGGRVEKRDADVPHAGSLDAGDVERMMKHVTRPTLRRMRGLALAAIRETFEETGLRLGVRALQPASAPAGDPWHEFLATGDIPTLDGLHYCARAITPPGRPRRFDTRFFVRDVTDVPDHTMIKPTPDSELVELVWVTLDQIDSLETVEITQIILAELKKQVATGFDKAQHRPFLRAYRNRFERVPT